MMDDTSVRERASTGIPGLDTVLSGGLPRERMYLIEGDPGTGKTTLGLQFLLEGARNGEPGLYVTFSETAVELEDVAASHGWSLNELTICDLAASEESLQAESQYTLFHPSEVELTETSRAVLSEVERIRPRRVVFDSLSEMRLLARDPLRYRRQILALKQYFAAHPATVLLLDYRTTITGDRQLQSLTHGVIGLDQLSPEYGGHRRRLRVQKLRGVPFRSGYHDFAIVTGGLRVFPRLVASSQGTVETDGVLPSGTPALDALLGGGLHAGTATLILGPAGVGKSVLGATYVDAEIRHGGRAAVYLFDEVARNYFTRNEALGIPVRRHAKNGRLSVTAFDPAEVSPGEFSDQVRSAVEDEGRRLVVIDSLNGYGAAMPEERYLSAHLHELLAYLNQRGVTTIAILAQHGVLGETTQAPVDLSYLADTVVLLRYFEAAGEVRQAISVVKKRTGDHERTIREFRTGPGGAIVGNVINEFSGVLTGAPVYLGDSRPVMPGENRGDSE